MLAIITRLIKMRASLNDKVINYIYHKLNSEYNL